MSNARSPREVCSTTIGTRGLMLRGQSIKACYPAWAGCWAALSAELRLTVLDLRRVGPGRLDALRQLRGVVQLLLGLRGGGLLLGLVQLLLAALERLLFLLEARADRFVRSVGGRLDDGEIDDQEDPGGYGKSRKPHLPAVGDDQHSTLPSMEGTDYLWATV